MKSLAVTPALLRRTPLPSLGEEVDKDARGRILIVAGGVRAPGAAVLCGEAALRVGAGKLQLAATDRFASPLAFALPESLVVCVARAPSGDIAEGALKDIAPLLAQIDAVVLGPGMLDEKVACALAAGLIAAKSKARFILDAGALTGLPTHAQPIARSAAQPVLTPHAGEMASLLGLEKQRVIDEPIDAALKAAALFNAIVVLKGETTWIAAPDQRVWKHQGGVVGLATSGSGDVLAGLIGGLLARGAPPATAALWGVWLHGRAGRSLSRRVGSVGFLAREIAAEVPAILASLAAPLRREADHKRRGSSRNSSKSGN